MKILSNNMYLLLIDEEAEIKYNTIIFESDTCLINIVGKGYIYNKADFKITAYRPLTKEAEELDLPLLPSFEVDIEKLACEKYKLKKGINDYDERYYNSHNIAKAEAFIEGYKAAQFKSQYSLEDVKKAIEMAREKCEPYYGGGGLVLSEPIYENKYLEEDIIESLSTPQLPKEFVPELIQDYSNRSCQNCNLGQDGSCELKLEKKCCTATKDEVEHGDYWISCLGDEADSTIYKYKTITNSEGKEELVGTWKF